MGGRGEKMNIFYGILLLIFGGFLMGLTVNDFGNIGNIILKIIGFIIVFVGFNYLSKHKSKRVKHGSGKQ